MVAMAQQWHGRGPAEAVLLEAVARRHYLHGESKVDIAQALGISRFKVARLIEEALELGVVRIEIVSPPGLDGDLSQRLRDRFGLRYAVAVRASSEDALRGEIATAATELLAEVLTSRDVLGLPWSRSVNDVVDRLKTLPPVPIVQLCGGLVVPGETGSSSDVVHRAAAIAGGERHVFYAPLILDDAESAAALRRHSAVKDAMAHVGSVTVALMGVGVWAAGGSTIFDAVGSKARREVEAAGVVGEMGGVLFDAVGRPVEVDFADRLIALNGKQLQGIAHVIGLAHGVQKVPAIRAALAGGLIRSLVTTTETAELLLGD